MDYRIYSEEEYYDRMQLLNIYNPSTCSLIWEEIIQYRELFKYSFQFSSRTHYITLNQTLLRKLIKVYECDCEKPLQDPQIHAFLKAHSGSKKEIIVAYLHLHNMYITQALITFLLDEQLLLLKVYIIYAHLKDMQFLALYLALFQHEEWLCLLKNIQLVDIHLEALQDLTKHFRDFLDSLYVNSAQNMIELNSTVLNTLSEDELLSRYPMCNKKQIQFYLNHCQSYHYYTIAQFMEMWMVSYETARKAMDLLVALRFYKKMKIGKKFVFTTVE